MPPSVKFYDRDGGTQITSEDWVDAFAGKNQIPQKFGVENNGDRILGSGGGPAGVELQLTAVPGNDGVNFMRHALDSATVGAPYGVAAVLLAGSGVWSATGNQFYRITATNTEGESIGSVEITINVDDVTKRVSLSWTQPTGATGYKVYRSTTSGVYTPTALRATIAGGGSTSFIDDGSATSSGSLPSVNTTAGWKVAPTLGPTADGGIWGSTGVRFWRVVALDSTGVEIANSLEASINVDDVTKRVTLTWTGVAAASSYRIYRSTSSGTYLTALRASISAPATSYIDNGAATTAGDLTTEPSYGVPPASGSFVQTALTLSSIAIGQQKFFWVNRVVPGATSEAGNKRLALTKVVEI